jgi:hypothetical protein
MHQTFSPHETSIREAIARFDDAYWLDKDRTGGFPEDFFQGFAARRGGSAYAFRKPMAARNSASPKPPS